MDELNKDLLAFYGVEIAARTGVNTGEVVANSDPDAEQRLATGDAVNVAARLEQAAPANEVLIGEVTYSLVRPYVEVEEVEPLELKGKAERVPAYRLIDVRDAAHDHQPSTVDAPLVGREPQLEALRAGLREVAGRGGARIATVLGEAGVGKSYLVDAFQVEVRDGDDRPPRPLPAVRRRHHVLAARRGAARRRRHRRRRLTRRGHREDRRGDRGRRRPAPRSGSGSRASPGCRPRRFPVTELFWGARKFLEALSAKRPVVLFIEDIHNAEETFLDLLEHLLDATAPQSAVLIVGTGRFLLTEKRPGWASRPGVTIVPMPALERGRDRAARRGAARRRPSRPRSRRGSSPRRRATRCSSRSSSRCSSRRA